MKKRLQLKLDCNSPKLTDQSYKKTADINNIMAQYGKNKVLPSTREHLARYIDNTQVLPLEEAHARIKDAQDLFYQLPSDIRKLMDNNPENMVDVINNPDHKELLVKKGIITDTINKGSHEDNSKQDVLPPKSQSGEAAKSE